MREQPFDGTLWISVLQIECSRRVLVSEVTQGDSDESLRTV